jgi:poly-beta-1,6-N-acetyl-D-glucosamine synthase
MKYVLITAARNEALYIRKTLESVVSQTILPVRWVIVSDASTDETDAIVRDFARRYQYIEFVRREPPEVRDFASQVYAQRFGWERLAGSDYDFIGMLDADISLPPDYYERVLHKFQANLRLGIAGGFIHEERGGAFRSRVANATYSVAGGIQLFRRECFDTVGGYIPLRWGGMDTVAEVIAQTRGWEVVAFPELPVFHHKPGESWTWSTCRRRICEGRMDYSLALSPLIQALKCFRRIPVERPYLVGALLRLWGYYSSALRQEKRTVPLEVIEFLRNGHRRRLERFGRAPAQPG